MGEKQVSRKVGSLINHYGIYLMFILNYSRLCHECG